MTTKKVFLALGQTVVTRGVNELMSQSPEYSDWVNNCLKRYILCDWGDLEAEDKALNDEAISKQGEDAGRVVAKYNYPGADIYIITEWDRSVTTVLFPSEY
jgi:hypothetical protein